MRSVRRRHRDSHPHRRGAEDQPAPGFPVRQRSRSASDNGQVAVRCQGSRIPWTDCVTRGNCPSNSQNTKLPPKIVVSQKGLRRYIGLVNFYRNYIPRLSQKFAPLHKLVKADKQLKVTNEILDDFKNQEHHQRTGQLWLKQNLHNKQYVLLPDANFKNAD